MKQELACKSSVKQEREHTEPGLMKRPPEAPCRILSLCVCPVIRISAPISLNMNRASELIPNGEGKKPNNTPA